ncbi:hypothetical protein IU433_12385 [Nocardia puris]|uniref:hypothetical protein n=1 Tax=Nocardia puris TaxID=208602 RepID=UPI001893888D|nr:hypothetical protein [Nocardia puris]MBF6459835.1 hypothetical protein [Nocardia puris]
MARYTDHDETAAEALALVEELRDRAPLAMYQRVAAHCRRDPERMAQVLMALAAFVDPDEPLSTLIARVEAIAAPRAVSA